MWTHSSSKHFKEENPFHKICYMFLNNFYDHVLYTYMMYYTFFYPTVIYIRCELILQETISISTKCVTFIALSFSLPFLFCWVWSAEGPVPPLAALPCCSDQSKSSKELCVQLQSEAPSKSQSHWDGWRVGCGAAVVVGAMFRKKRYQYSEYKSMGKFGMCTCMLK